MHKAVRATRSSWYAWAQSGEIVDCLPVHSLPWWTLIRIMLFRISDYIFMKLNLFLVVPIFLVSNTLTDNRVFEIEVWNWNIILYILRFYITLRLQQNHATSLLMLLKKDRNRNKYIIIWNTMLDNNFFFYIFSCILI